MVVTAERPCTLRRCWCVPIVFHAPPSLLVRLCACPETGVYLRALTGSASGPQPPPSPPHCTVLAGGAALAPRWRPANVVVSRPYPREQTGLTGNCHGRGLYCGTCSALWKARRGPLEGRRAPRPSLPPSNSRRSFPHSLLLGVVAPGTVKHTCVCVSLFELPVCAPPPSDQETNET